MAQNQSIVIENGTNHQKNGKESSTGKKHVDAKEESSFREELDVLLNNMTMHCYRHLAQTDRSNWEKLMWFMIHVVNAIVLANIIISAWNGFTENPLVTTLHNTIYPVGDVPFPGFVICDNNRISRVAAQEFANELSTKDIQRRNSSYFLEKIKFLGRLYDFDAVDELTIRELQEILDLYDSGSDGNFDVMRRMRMLSPQCETMLLRCFWNTIEYPCLQQPSMMETRRTPYGFCCAFNYQARTEKNMELTSSFHIDVTGPDMGLIILINGTSSDYFYPIFNSVAFNIQIFNPYEFLDGTSGSVTQKFISFGTENYIRIDAMTITSQDDVLSYSIDKRECLFRKELSHKFGGRYGRSDCIVTCRVRSSMALCGCVPFFYNTINYDVNDEAKYCTVQDIPCLNKYKIKWQTIVTKISNIVGLEREMEESLYCPECLPSCSDSKYKVSHSYLKLRPSTRRGFNILEGIKNVSDVSVIRVFFGQPETILYKQDVSLYWYEIFSNFGGMFGIMAGFSCISGIEIVYFFVKQLLVMIWNKTFANIHLPSHHEMDE